MPQQPTTYEQIKKMLEAPEPMNPVAPKEDLNPDDFIVWGEGEYEEAVRKLDEGETRR